MDESPFKYSELVDADEVKKSGSFTSLPVRKHIRDDIANTASLALIRDWGETMHDGREKITHCSMWERSNLLSLLFPECNPDRLGLLTYITDLGLMHDDVCEEMSVEAATAEHNDLVAALDFSDNRTLNKQSRSANTKKLASNVLLECMKIDHNQSIVMLEAYTKDWLAVMEHPNTDEIQTLQEYFIHRSKNVGCVGYWAEFNFGLGILLTEEEAKLVDGVRDVADRAFILTNDYWSWDREREEAENQDQGRIFNAAVVIMRQDGVTAVSALEKMKNLILEFEAEYEDCRAKLYKENPSLPMHLRRWVEAAGISISGHNYWAANCPRHNNWKSKPPAAPKEHVTLSQLSAMGKQEPLNPSHVVKSELNNLEHIDPHINGVNDINDANGVNGVNGANGANGAANSRNNHINGYSFENGWEPNETKKSSSHQRSLQPTQSTLQRQRPTPLSTPPSTPPNEDKKPKLADTHTLAPCNYISSLPSKGFRTALVEALQIWLQVDKTRMDTIKRVIDLLHNSSLILDDIQDNSTLRRGRPTAHIVFGEAQAINSATFVYVSAVKLVHQMGSSITMDALLEELENLFVGQGWDLYWKHHLHVPSEDEYLQMVDLKTGGLFRLLARLMLAGAKKIPTDDEIDFFPLSCLLGRFFQIRDDYMNISSAVYTQNKGFCEDMDEGKISYLVVHCCAQSAQLHDHVLGMFRSTVTNGNMSVEGKKYVLSCMEQAGSMQATRKLLVELEDGIDEEISRLEERFEEDNPVLRLLVASLSVKKEIPPA